MPVQTSYPGVYVQELPSGQHSIVGVSTSIAMFIGRAIQGPVDEPQLCLSYSDYVRAFTADLSFSDMALQVQQFFLNGGSECYALRIVNTTTASYATAVLKNSNGVVALTLASISPGASGNALQCVVDYKTGNPESTFNLTVYTYSINASGVQVIGTSEKWAALSMNPVSPMYAINYLNQNSNLVNCPVQTPIAVTANGYSRSGGPVLIATLISWLNTVGSVQATNYNAMFSINGGPPLLVSLLGMAGTDGPSTATKLTTFLGTALAPIFPSGVGISVTDYTLADNSFFLIFTLTGPSGYDINITPASANDFASQMLLGFNQGGIEKSAYADSRPAPNGVVFQPTDSNLNAFAVLKWTDVATMQVNTAPTAGIPTAFVPPAVPVATPLMYNGSNSTNDIDGIRQKWGFMAGGISSSTLPWTAQVWGSRLAILPAPGSLNSVGQFTTAATNIGFGGAPDMFTENVSYYSFGNVLPAGLQAAGTPGVDGGAPTQTDYENAFDLIDNTVDIFNLMILAKDNTTGAGAYAPTPLIGIWGAASAFCQLRRAMLLVDPPDTPDSPPAPWTAGQNITGSQIVQNATDTSKGVDRIRQGLINDHCALYFPRVAVTTTSSASYLLAPSGTMAGVMARIDTSRGVWKAPAGTEANLIGVNSLEVKFTDLQNGVLNPHGINALRSFPDGIVSWGARTLAGDDDFQSQWKYISVRRTAMYIEESLYRGLKWVVFEPNAALLWSQIRLNVGSFMQGLYIQGAFAGTTPANSYFVACDLSTTPPDVQALGIVNIIVGFAPLYPAEFVVLSIQQMAGQNQ